MAKFYGVIGYAVTEETKPGVWAEKIIERMYYGDLTRNTRRLQSAEQLNDNINVANEISIVADPFANENFHSMRYVEFMGAKWKCHKCRSSVPKTYTDYGRCIQWRAGLICKLSWKKSLKAEMCIFNLLSR